MCILSCACASYRGFAYILRSPLLQRCPGRQPHRAFASYARHSHHRRDPSQDLSLTEPFKSEECTDLSKKYHQHHRWYDPFDAEIEISVAYMQKEEYKNYEYDISLIYQFIINGNQTIDINENDKYH